MNTHRKINIDHTPNSSETQQALNKLYEEYKDILHYSDKGHTILFTLGIDTGDHAPITEKHTHYH